MELLKESPSPSLRSCWALAQAYNTLARELFNAAFVSCWMELRLPLSLSLSVPLSHCSLGFIPLLPPPPRQVNQDDLVTNLKQALTLQNIPEITQTILNLAEFMEHCEEATVREGGRGKEGRKGEGRGRGGEGEGEGGEGEKEVERKN